MSSKTFKKQKMKVTISCIIKLTKENNQCVRVRVLPSLLVSGFLFLCFFVFKCASGEFESFVNMENTEYFGQIVNCFGSSRAHVCFYFAKSFAVISFASNMFRQVKLAQEKGGKNVVT